MPAYKSGKKTQQYLTEFKVTVVRLSLRSSIAKRRSHHNAALAV